MMENLGNPSAVKKYFDDLAQHFPELHVSYKAMDKEPTKVKNEMNEEDMNEEEMNEEEEEEAKPKKQEPKPRRQKTKEEIKEILISSIKNQDALKSYENVDMKTTTEQDCLDTLDILNKAVIDARKRIVLFTAMQGEVLHKLRKLTKCSVNNLIEKTGYSSSYVYFILKLHTLVSEFDKLRHSDLKLSFFKTNMKIITEICKEDRHQFQ